MPFPDDVLPDASARNGHAPHSDADRPLQTLLQTARRLARGTDAEAMAALAATELLTAQPPPPSFRTLLDRMRRRAARDPQWQAQYDRVARRVRDLHDRCDPREHFERLTGRSLDVEG
ncbi:MAG: hypothetical protein GVY18_01310 [Bacteroidetes bacterium]|jgi:hypothetical protein|nr:hypothetical protein [Bacteroidota bacterium]